MADTVDNPQIQKQLNDLLEQRKKTIKDTNRLMQEQVSIANEIKEALGASVLKSESVDRVNSMKDAIDEASKSAQEFADTNQDLASLTSDALDETDGGFEDLISSYKGATKEASLWGSASAGFISGISTGFNFLKNGLQGVLSLTGTVVTGIFSISKAILSIPFKIFNAFVAEANRGGGGTELRQAYENVRKEFGDFGESMSQNVIKGARSMRGELDKTGLSVYRTAGRLYERLNLIRELATEMGATFNTFGKEISANAEAMVAYQKGLGQTNEAMKSLAQFTMSTGDTFEETLRTVTKFSTSLGTQFNISQKVIARDVGEMTKDLKTFGSVGVREMAQLSVYARKLGTDFKELLGVVDKFDNFEDAADSAARLAQAFGVNVDVMKLIAEQDVGKRVDMIRNSFFAAGKSIDKLTRQERNYLATATGIEDQALNSVFAFENQAKSYDEVAAAGQTAEQQQITQAEAMGKLSASIERLVRSGQRTGGFFDRFVQGFRRGVRWSKEFWGIMRNIRRSLWATERAGVRVGRAFVKSFPGMKKFLGGVKDFFSPAKFRKMGAGVVSSFRRFFKDLSSPKTAQKALGDLLNNFQKTFFGMVDREESAMGKIIGGLKKSFKAVGQIALSGLNVVMKNVKKVFDAITMWMQGDHSFTDALKEVFSDGSVVAVNVFSDMWDEIQKQMGPVADELWKSTKKMFSVAFKKLGNWLETIDWWGLVFKAMTSKAGIATMALIMGPPVISGMVAGVSQTFAAAMSKQLTTGMASASSKVDWSRLLQGGAKGGLVAAAIALAALIAYNVYETYKGMQELHAFQNKAYKQTISRNNRLFSEREKQIKQLGVEKSAVANLMQLKGKAFGDELNNLSKVNNLNAKNLELLRDQRKAVLANDIARSDLMATKKAEANLDLKSGLAFDLVSGRATMDALFGQKSQGKRGGVGFLGKGEQGFESSATAKELASIDAQTEGLIAKSKAREAKDAAAMEATARLKRRLGMGSGMDVSDSELSGFDRIKKLKPKQVESIIKTFREKIKPLLIGKDGNGGLRKDILDIGKAFQEEEIGKAILAVEAVNQMGKVSTGLSDLAKSKSVNTSKIDESINSMKSAIIGLNDPELFESFSQLNANKSALSQGIVSIDQITTSIGGANLFYQELNKFNKGKKGGNDQAVQSIVEMVSTSNAINSKLSSLDTSAANLVSVSKMASSFEQIEEGTKMFSGKKGVTEIPVVKGIIKMIEAANIINKELASINEINVSPKMKNLGKALGIGGSESLEIRHKNFNVNINVEVKLDPSKLAESVVSTGKVMKSNKLKTT